MSRGCGKAQRGLTRGNLVGAKTMSNGGRVGAKYMAIGGNPGDLATGGFGTGNSSNAGAAGSANRSTSGGNVSAGSNVGGNAGGGGAGNAKPGETAMAQAAAAKAGVSAAGSLAAQTKPTSVAARNAALGNAAAQSARLGDLPAASMVGAGVDPYTATRAAQTIASVVANKKSIPAAALRDMGNGNINISTGPDYLVDLSSGTPVRIPLDQVQIGKFQERLPGYEETPSLGNAVMDRGFGMTTPSPTVARPTVSGPSIGQIKAADYQGIANQAAANLKAQGIDATQSQINQLAFGSAYLKGPTPPGAQIQKLNRFNELLKKGTPTSGKFDVSNLSAAEQAEYAKLSAEAQSLIAGNQVRMYSPTSDLSYGDVPPGFTLNTKTGFLESPDYRKVFGPVDVPTNYGTFQDATFYAPKTAAYAPGSPGKIVSRPMSGALANYPAATPAPNVNQSSGYGFTMDTVPVPHNMSGRMAGLASISSPQPTEPGFTMNTVPVPHNMSGRMAGLQTPSGKLYTDRLIGETPAAPPAQSPKPITDRIPEAPASPPPSVTKPRVTPTIPSGKTPYSGNWSGAPSFTSGPANIGKDRDRADRTARNGKETVKTNPYEPNSPEWLNWEKQYKAKQVGDVSSTSTLGSTARNGGLIRRDGVVKRGRTRGRYI